MDRITTRITSGSRDWSRYYGRGTATFIMAQNVRRGHLDLTFRQAVDPPENSRDRARTQVQPGDLLVTIVGANTGDVCPVSLELPEHYVCQSVALMRPISSELTPYLNMYLNSDDHGRAQFNDFTYGAGRPHLSFEQLGSTVVALPPIAEQQEIAHRVEALFGLAQAAQARVAATAQRADQLGRAVLAKAFRGELVSTEAELARQENREYEPASALLERIRANAADVRRAPRSRERGN